MKSKLGVEELFIAQFEREESGAHARVRAERRAVLARELCGVNGIQYVQRGDTAYPEPLEALSNPPPLVTYQGNVGLLTRGLRLTIAGTRSPSAWAMQAAEGAAARAASCGFCVVSGLARGCDTQAHLGAMKAKGYTISVEATALTTVYPSENRGLAAQLLRQYGCRISAVLPGQATPSYRFAVRDSYQAALGHALLVVEAGLSSGTMHTAKEARRLGKSVACLVPELPLTTAVAWLLEHGAVAIRKPEELNVWLDSVRKNQKTSD